MKPDDLKEEVEIEVQLKAMDIFQNVASCKTLRPDSFGLWMGTLIKKT